MADRPRLIGVAGPSCSGKTTLARLLAQRLPGPTTIFSFDSYYRDFANLPTAAKARFNFDAPEALDSELLIRQLESLARGESIERPIYRFETHSRAAECEHLDPGRHIVVEGLFALHWERLRPLYSLSVFVRADDRLCLERRLTRDVAERGRTQKSVLSQYEEQVRPMSHRYVLPSQKYADLVVDGGAPIAESTAAVLSKLDRHAFDS
ncbi:MAG: uridine kinase [Gemmatimonadetes bacterium]|nr:uridine kinase [Gemmatimonadota bacterium]